MKFSIVVVLSAAAFSQSSAFHASSFASRTFPTRLSVTTLEDWQLLDNGSVVGSVRGHPQLNDGDVITTSPLANPAEAGASTTVATMSGSQYMLGTPMPRQVRSEEGTLTRGAVIRGAAIAAMTAGGFALGLAAGNGGGGLSLAPSPISVPEVSGILNIDKGRKLVLRFMGLNFFEWL